MGLYIRRVTEHDQQDEDGFWYHIDPDGLGYCPPGSNPELNMLTIGWRRFQDGNRTREVIRLPESCRWIQIGQAVISNGGRDIERTVKEPKGEDGYAALEGHSIFDPNGYLTKYFIERGGHQRIQCL